MSEDQQILSALRTAGERITVSRRAMIRMFVSANTPLTATDVLSSLSRSRVSVNKTTVYRELQFLREKGFIRALQFDERNKRYELVPSEHRHHLICTACKKIDDIVLDHDLDQVERTLAKNKRFKVQRHALEFYGLCGECQ